MAYPPPARPLCIVDIVDIVEIDDTVGIIDTVDIVDTVEAIWNNTRLCSNLSQKR